MGVNIIVTVESPHAGIVWLDRDYIGDTFLNHGRIPLRGVIDVESRSIAGPRWHRTICGIVWQGPGIGDREGA